MVLEYVADIMSVYIQDIRGKTNTEISNKFASHIGTLIGNYIGPGRTILIGRDAANASQMIKRSITSGLMSAGINVVDFGIAPLPLINYSKKAYNAQVVITVSESHLRGEDVNIKIISSHEIPLEQRHAQKVSWDKIGDLRYVNEGENTYQHDVLENAAPEIKNKNFLVVIDCAQGKGISFIPEIMDTLECETVYIGCSDNLLKRSYPEPSPTRLSLISDLVFAAGADLGVYLDNDQDHIIFINEKGDIIRDQEATGIFTHFMLNENPKSTIVSSVVASLALDDIVKKQGGRLIKTSIKHVLKEISDHKAIFGADEPGMYVFPQFQSCFDGIYALVMMLGILAKKDVPLSKLVHKVPPYNRTVFTIPCENEKKMNVLDQFQADYSSKYEISRADGIRVDLKDSFILIRPSRFEPLIRAYIESKSEDKLHKLTESVKRKIEGISQNRC